MAQIRDYRKLAHDIICEVGGKENIVNATRCATRLRLVLKEEPEQAKEKVAAMAGVITVVENSGQFQVVIGTHVGEVYDAVAEELHLDTENLQVEQPVNVVILLSNSDFVIRKCSPSSTCMVYPNAPEVRGIMVIF